MVITSQHDRSDLAIADHLVESQGDVHTALSILVEDARLGAHDQVVSLGVTDPDVVIAILAAAPLFGLMGRDALRLISQYPVFGVGFGSAPSLDLYVGSSSIYLLMASQTGLVGTSIFLVAMVVLLRQSHDVLVRRPGGPVEPVLRGATAGLLGALAAGLFDHYFFNLQFPHAIALFWLFCGMVAASAAVLEQPAAVVAAMRNFYGA